jgi:hypothetical protein
VNSSAYTTVVPRSSLRTWPPTLKAWRKVSEIWPTKLRRVPADGMLRTERRADQPIGSQAPV